jgi:hypothetical protein
MECPNHNAYILMINFIQVIHITTNSSFKYLHPQGNNSCPESWSPRANAIYIFIVADKSAFSVQKSFHVI